MKLECPEREHVNSSPLPSMTPDGGIMNDRRLRLSSVKCKRRSHPREESWMDGKRRAHVPAAMGLGLEFEPRHLVLSLKYMRQQRNVSQQQQFIERGNYFRKKE